MVAKLNDFDVVVIGTGAGGACAAYQMAMAGMKVLAVEKGPWRKLEDIVEGGIFGTPFDSRGRGDELKYIRERFLQPNLSQEIRLLQYAEHGSPEPNPQPTTDGWMSQVVGGGTVHYGGASFRFEPVDFRMSSSFDATCPDLPAEHQAELRDWVVGFDEFKPWYEMAERLIGVAGAPGSNLPPLRHNKAEMLIRDALHSGSSLRVEPTPMAINSDNHGGRNKCQNSGLCQDYACRFEAKSDMRVTLLRDAQARGSLTVLANTFVRRIIVEAGSARALECIVSDARKSPEIRLLTAPIVVIACEAVESIRLLLNSHIGNPDVLGRYIMFHVTGGARSLAPEPTTTWDNAPHTAYIRGLYHDRQAGDHPFLKTGILLISALGGPLQAATGQWGERALLFYNRVYPYRMDLSYVGEGMPTRYNRVDLLADRVDQYGMPGTIISYRPHPFDINAGRYIEKRCKDLLRLAKGATEDDVDAELKPFLKKETTSKRLIHGSGGCRFGEDPKDSVLDRHCRVHDVSNLFVTDGSFMPTGSGLNPTLTIQANALRVGDYIATQFGRR